MIAVARTPIDPDETAGELEDRLAPLGAPLVAEAIAALEAGTATVLPQDKVEGDQGPQAPQGRRPDRLVEARPGRPQPGPRDAALADVASRTWQAAPSPAASRAAPPDRPQDRAPLEGAGGPPRPARCSRPTATASWSRAGRGPSGSWSSRSRARRPMPAAEFLRGQPRLPGDSPRARSERRSGLSPAVRARFPSTARRWYNPQSSGRRLTSNAADSSPATSATETRPAAPGAHCDHVGPDAPLEKKLYIETVGCQMNVLDSELVVGKLRSEGYELTDDIDQADTILYNTCSVRQHAEDKIYSALGRVRRLKERKPDADRSACSAAWRRRTRSRSSSGPRTSTWSSAPGSSAGSRSCSTMAKDDGKPQMAVSLAADRRLARDRDRQLRRVRPAPRAGDAAEPVPGVRPDHDGVRQVLHLLHRPLGPRPRAEPAAAARSSTRRGSSPTRGSRRSPCSARPSTATSTASPTAGRPGSPTCSRGCTTSPASSGSSSSPTSPTT